MNSIIKKRTDLINFFKNEDKTYNMEDILYKEFSVLSFSPRQEYIDVIKSEFDDLITKLNFDNLYDIEECFLKGLVIDVDRKKDYSIIHLFDKVNNISISMRKELVERYNDYLEVGEPVFIKCHIFNERFYLDFLVSLHHIEDFKTEVNYLNGRSIAKINQYKNSNLGIIKQCTYFVSKKGNPCLRLSLKMACDEVRNVISCQNSFNTLPKGLISGDIVEFDSSNNPNFVNHVRKLAWYK